MLGDWRGSKSVGGGESAVVSMMLSFVASLYSKLLVVVGGGGGKSSLRLDDCGRFLSFRRCASFCFNGVSPFLSARGSFLPRGVPRRCRKISLRREAFVTVVTTLANSRGLGAVAGFCVVDHA